MNDVLHCSNCGAPITVPPGASLDALVTCPFCGAQVERAAAPPVQVSTVSTVSTSSNVVVVQGAEGMKQLSPDQRARVQQALELMERQFGVEPQPRQYASGEAELKNAPLSDWDVTVQPPARRSSGLKLALLGIALLLVLAVIGRILGVPW